MKIRLHGLPEEVEQTKELLKALVNVTSSSEPYHDRGDSQYVRCYLEIEPQMSNGIKALIKNTNIDFLYSNALLASLLDCKNCPLNVNCFALKNGLENSLSGCSSMFDVVAAKLDDRLKIACRLDKKLLIRDMLEDFCTKKDGDKQ